MGRSLCHWALAGLPALDGILFSGGVSEYIYGREASFFGDLGPYLGEEIRKEAKRHGSRSLTLAKAFAPP